MKSFQKKNWGCGFKVELLSNMQKSWVPSEALEKPNNNPTETPCLLTFELLCVFEQELVWMFHL